MADVDLLPPRGVPYLALVDANGVAIGGTSTIALLASKGMKAICQVDMTGIALSDGASTVALLASRGIRAFAAVDENGVSVDDAVTKADVIRSRGIRPMVAVDVNGVSQTGPATIPVIAQRGLGYFCPVDETGTAGSLIPVPPNTIRARPGIFILTGETMTPIAGYAITAGMGAFALIDPGTTNLNAIVAASTVWNNADKGTDWVLSGTPLLVAATNTAIGGSEIARATASHSSGKYYFEYTLNFVNTYTCIGIANAAHPLVGQFLGGDTNGLSWVPAGNCFINSIPVTLSAFTTGNTMGLAFDLSAKKFWGRVNGGNWNNDILANQNPATGAGGRDLSTLAAGPYFPAAFDLAEFGQVTANFGQSAYANAAPSGFGNW